MSYERGRPVKIHLTEKGVSVHALAEGLVADIEEQMIAVLEDHEREQLRSLLERLTKWLSDKTEPAPIDDIP
jgi:DNA-binding MarR family transcriptional regulator